MTHTGTLSSNIAELYEVDHGKNMNPKMYLRIFEFQQHWTCNTSLQQNYI